MYTGPNIITDGLVLALDAANPKSYPGSGTVWKDLSGQGNDGTLVNGPTFDSGNGGSIVFDGVNDYVNTLYNPSISFLNTSPYTISAWVKGNNLPSGFDMVVSNENNVGLGRDGINMTISTLNETTARITHERFTQGNQRGISILILTEDYLNKYNNIVLIYDSTNRYLVINSIFSSGISDSGNKTNTTTPFRVGSRANGGNHYSGNISNVSIYNRALTPQEIQQNYNATKSRYGL